MSEDPSHLDDTSGWSDSAAREEDETRAGDGDEIADELLPDRPVFLHPRWTVGMILVFAVVFLLLGILGHPLWLLIGSPFILTLVVWVMVRWTERRRGRPEAHRDGGDEDS